MNTGIGDGVNLAWKLAAVIQGRANHSLLDTYESERIAFAHSLVSTTDRMFKLMTGSGKGQDFFRENIFPHFVPFALGFPGARAGAFRLVSQIRVNYHESALSEGEAGEIHGGDRLPWIPFDEGRDNFQPLRSLDWQAHVYGTASQSAKDTAGNVGLALHEFSWTEAVDKAGLARDALYLVRPDGYVALADADQNVEKLQALLARFSILSRQDEG